MHKLFLMSLASAALLLPVAAHASMITRTYTFEADFTEGPITSIAGSFTATFDPTGTGGTLDAFRSNLPSTYQPVSFGNDYGLISVGDACSSTGCAGEPFSNSFYVGTLVDDAGAPLFLQSADYYVRGSGDPYVSDNVNFALSSVPLPSGAGLFGVALILLGGIGCCRAASAKPTGIT